MPVLIRLIETNRGLLAFALLLIVAGAVSGVYLVSILGFFMFFPAIIPQNRPRLPRAPGSTTTVSQSPQPTYDMPTGLPPEPTLVTPRYSIPAPTTAPTTQYSAPLFPTPMFPSFVQPMQPQVAKEPPTATQAKDDTFEVIALLVLLGLVRG